MSNQEQDFWKMVDLHTRNPRLAKTIEDWRRYVSNTPFYELEHGLVGYFGLSKEQSNAWIDWKQSVDLRDDALLIQAKLDVAKKLTWEDKLPGRFEWLLDVGWEDPDAICSVCGQHHT